MTDTIIQHGRMTGSDDADIRDAVVQAEGVRWELVSELAGLGATMSAAMDAIPGFVPCGHAFAVVIDGLAASAASPEPSELAALVQAVRARSEHVAGHRGVPQGPVVDVRARLGEGDGDAGLRAQLLAMLQGIALAAQRAMELGVMSDDIDVALAHGLSALDGGREELGRGLEECGVVAPQVFSLVQCAQ